MYLLFGIIALMGLVIGILLLIAVDHGKKIKQLEGKSDTSFERMDWVKEYLILLGDALGYRFTKTDHIHERKPRPSIVKVNKDMEGDQCERAKPVHAMIKGDSPDPLASRGEMGGQRFAGPTEIVRTGDRRDGKDRRNGDRRAPVKKKKKNRKQTKRKRG